MTRTRTTRTMLTVVAALAAATLGTAAGAVLFAHEQTSHAVALAAMPGRGQERPWWETTPPLPKHPRVAVETFVIPADVLFNTDSASVNDTGRRNLLALTRAQLRDAKTIVIAGTTDSRGTRTHNLRLSHDRANAAAAVLIAAGIDPHIIHTQAWADDHPVADEHGPDPSVARARNRRVVIQVTT